MKVEPLLEQLRGNTGGGSRVRDWSLFLSESRQLSLGIKDREAGNPHAPLSLAESGGMQYLLIWEDGLVSRGFFERTLYEDDPATALAEARTAAYDDPDAAQVSPAARVPEVKTHDAGAAAVAGGETGPIIRRLEEIRRRLAEHPVRTWSGSFGASESRSLLLTSAGFEGSGLGTSIGWHVTLDGQIGDGYSSRRADSNEAFSRRLGGLLDTAAELRRQARPLHGGQHPILLHPRVVEEYVLDTLLTNLDGATVAHRSGAFGVEQFDGKTALFREDLRLRVDPLVPLKRGSYRFSSEGVPAAPCSFIERGCLVQPILGLKYGRRLGRLPTATPAATDTLHFEGGTPIPRDEALARADGGVVVLSVLGVHTQDSTSGDFSLSAPQVLAVRDGAFAGKLRATLSGNLFELLRRDDLQWVTFEGECTPGLLYRGRIDPN